MSQYFTGDWADFTTCSGAACGDWTLRYRTNTPFSPANPVVTPASGASDWTALTWNDVDGDANRGNVELLLKASFSATPRHFAIVRGSGADESATLYSLYAGGTALRVYYCSGTDTPTQVATVARTHTAGVSYWFRFRINGSGPTTVQAKSWSGLITDEPAGWQIDTTDSSGPTAAGWVGPSDYNLGGGATITQFGVGTNGDSAPDTAPSSGADLTIAEAAHAHAADNLALTTDSTLTIQDATHGHTVDNLGLTTDSALTIADATHGHAADNLTLTATSGDTLTVNDATHGHAADAPGLTTAAFLAVADATHAHAADNLGLTTASALTVQDSTHGHAADNVTLTAPVGPTLTFEDAAHAHAADSLGLTTATALSVDDATHGHVADTVGLGSTSEVSLLISDALHAHLADNVAINDDVVEPPPVVIDIPAPPGSGGVWGLDQIGRTQHDQAMAARMQREAEAEVDELLAVLTAIGVFA